MKSPSLAGLRLAGGGELDLDAPIGSYLPGLGSSLRALTARMLLGDRGSLPNRASGPLASLGTPLLA